MSAHPWQEPLAPSLDEVIRNLRRESDAAMDSAKAAFAGTPVREQVTVPRRFPDPDTLFEPYPAPRPRGARVPRR